MDKKLKAQDITHEQLLAIIDLMKEIFNWDKVLDNPENKPIKLKSVPKVLKGIINDVEVPIELLIRLGQLMGPAIHQRNLSQREVWVALLDSKILPGDEIVKSSKLAKSIANIIKLSLVK